MLNAEENEGPGHAARPGDSLGHISVPWGVPNLSFQQKRIN